MICAREFFCGADPVEAIIRKRIDSIIDQIEWDWYTKGGKATLFWHWSPKHGWRKNLTVSGWNEALMTYVLALGARTYAIDADLYHSGWARFGHFRNGASYYGLELPLGKPFGGPLFLSQLPFCVLDPRLWQDGYADYWQQASAHAAVNYRHCLENPHNYREYGPNCWGLTACHGPDGYLICCPVNDMGIVAPSASLSSFPFLPEQAETALRFFLSYQSGRLLGRFGFVDAFAPETGWVARTSLALNQGSTLAMIENYRTGLLWKLFAKASEWQKARRLIAN
nr:glucoamylase family protein [Falsochrobactrum shanghaiense]